MASRNLVVRIIGDADSLQREFRKADRSVTRFGGRLGTLGKLGVAGGAAAGLAVVGRGLVSAAKAAQEAETAQVRLRQALKVSNVSFAKHGKAIDKAIQNTSKLAALDDEELSDAFAKLLRTTGDVNDAMRDMALAADIARGRNISLEQAVRIVEKAEVGQLRGLKAIGVQVDKNTTSTQALERAQQKFAGSAERYGKTAAGAQDQLRVAFENLQERVGKHLLPVLTKLALKLVALIDWAEQNWPRFRKSIDPVVKAVQTLGSVVQVMYRIVQPILEVWFGKVFPVQMKIAGLAIQGLGIYVKLLGRTFQVVVRGILYLVDKFLLGLEKMAEAASHVPFVGDQFKGVAKKIAQARRSIEGLNAQLDALDGKTVRVNVVTKAVSQIEDRRADLPLRPRPRGTTAPAPAPRATRGNLSVGSRETPVVVHTTVNLDGQKVATNTTRHQQKSARRIATQTTGPYAGNGSGFVR